jgi:hypothetical protein
MGHRYLREFKWGCRVKFLCHINGRESQRKHGRLLVASAMYVWRPAHGIEVPDRGGVHSCGWLWAQDSVGNHLNVEGGIAASRMWPGEGQSRVMGQG